MRIVFLGTPEFAVPSLEALVEADHRVAAVFTQPDRPKGRGQTVAQSPVKQAAIRLGLPVFQPERVRRPDSQELLRGFGADLMVVVGYGQIIPQSIIDMPSLGILNVHASLLPKYRGAAPIQWAIANGERLTGVTIMRIDAGLDTGDMLAKAETEIGERETAPELSVRLAALGAPLLVRVIQQLAEGTAQPEPQKHSEATLAPILKKEDGLVDWRRPAAVVDARARGFHPWPGAYTTFRGQQLSLSNLRPMPAVETPAHLAPGVLFPAKRRLFAGSGKGTALELLELQPSGRKRMTAEAFLNGYKVQAGELLGSGQVLDS